MNDRTIQFTLEGKEYTARVSKNDGEVPTRYSVMFEDDALAQRFGKIADYYEIDQHLKYDGENTEEGKQLHAAVLTELIKIRAEL